MLNKVGRRAAAIVVSYNDVAALEATMAALRPQVAEIIIVDNGSADTCIEQLRFIANCYRARLVRLERNQGIGAALNMGLNTAEAERAEWILTMDQDSIVASDFLDALALAITRNPSVQCLAASFSSSPDAHPSPWRRVEYAITSGNLLSAQLIQQVGWFDEGLFIDGVDFDYSLRVRLAGHQILQVRAARMLHRLGDRPSTIPFHTHHSPLRRYYMVRNFIILARRYAASHPRFVARLGIVQLLSAILAVILGPSRRSSLASITRGLVDGVLGRQGQRASVC